MCLQGSNLIEAVDSVGVSQPFPFAEAANLEVSIRTTIWIFCSVIEYYLLMLPQTSFMLNTAHHILAGNLKYLQCSVQTGCSMHLSEGTNVKVW